MTLEAQWDKALKHYGVKGMKWGVRKDRTSSERVMVLKKGESLHHVSSNQKLELKKRHPLYTSFTEKDRALYRGSYAEDLMFRDNLDKAMEYELTAVKDLVAPSKEKAIREFIDLHKNDTDILQRMAEDRTKSSIFLSLAKHFGFDPKNRNYNKYKRELEDPKKQERAFEDFAAFLAFSKESRQKYFARLEEQGYNSISSDSCRNLSV